MMRGKPVVSPRPVSKIMPDKHLIRISKFISLVLRHQPEIIGLTLDKNGWATMTDLIAGAQHAGVALDRPLLEMIAREDDKQRFSFSPDGRMIRANQGHSLDIDLGLEPAAPPGILFHGTAERNVPAIKKQGLLRKRRHHVHLSPNETTAMTVGRRHGTPVVLCIDSGRMNADGYLFYLSSNGIWLTEQVPAAYIYFPWNRLVP